MKKDKKVLFILFVAYILLITIVIIMLISKTSECHNKGGKYIGGYCVREEYLIDDKKDN